VKGKKKKESDPRKSPRGKFDEEGGEESTERLRGNCLEK